MRFTEINYVPFQLEVFCTLSVRFTEINYVPFQLEVFCKVCTKFALSPLQGRPTIAARPPRQRKILYQIIAESYFLYTDTRPHFVQSFSNFAPFSSSVNLVWLIFKPMPTGLSRKLIMMINILDINLAASIILFKSQRKDTMHLYDKSFTY